jgi:hypothetical protein
MCSTLGVLKLFGIWVFWIEKKGLTLELRFLGFRELREAGRNHFHLSWYLSVPVVTSYRENPWFHPGF